MQVKGAGDLVGLAREHPLLPSPALQLVKEQQQSRNKAHVPGTFTLEWVLLLLMLTLTVYSGTQKAEVITEGSHTQHSVTE